MSLSFSLPSFRVLPSPQTSTMADIQSKVNVLTSKIEGELKTLVDEVERLKVCPSCRISQIPISADHAVCISHRFSFVQWANRCTLALLIVIISKCPGLKTFKMSDAPTKRASRHRVAELERVAAKRCLSSASSNAKLPTKPLQL